LHEPEGGIKKPSNVLGARYVRIRLQAANPMMMQKKAVKVVTIMWTRNRRDDAEAFGSMLVGSKSVYVHGSLLRGDMTSRPKG
jgi:hypothetical protein